MVELKKIIALVLFLLGSHILVAQTISVTATLTDSDSQTWNYGTCAINLIPSNYGPSYYGSVLLPTSYACSISSVGVLTATLYNSSTVTPVIAQYKFTICPHASAACTTLSVPITTANQSSILSALLVAPRFTTGPNSYGYLDAEVSPGIIGGQYFNVTTSVSRQCTVITNGACTTWVNAAPTDSPVFTTEITTPLIVGPATHSTGSCSVIGVELSQDGYISWCNGTIWAILVSPPA